MTRSLIQSVFVTFTVVCALAGCSSPSEFNYDALDLVPPHEELLELDLGKYSIPIPVIEDRTHSAVHQTRLQLDFELYALVRPNKKSAVLDSYSRHEGKIRDHVIRVCRNASVEDLQEPELSTLKARLMDALATEMGRDDVRQLLITEVVSQPL